MLKKIFTAVVARSGGAVSGVLLTLVVARVLPIEQAGYFLLGWTVLAFLRPISVFGTNTSSLRNIGGAFEFGQWPEIHGYTLKTLAIVTVMTSVLALVVWLLAPVIARSFWDMPEMADVLRIIALAVLPMGLTLLISSFYQAIARTVTAVFIMTVNLSAALAAIIFVARIETATTAAWVLVAVAWTNTVLSLAWWLLLMRGHAPRMPTAKEVMAPALTIWVATLMTTTTKWNGQIIAASWVSASEIAYLAVAQRVSLAVSFIMIAINLVTAPKFAGLHKKNDIQAMQNLASKTTYVMIAIGVAVFIGIVSLSSPVMALFGEEFRDHGGLLVILATGQLVNAITGSSGYLLIMGGYQTQYRNLIMASTAASIALSFLLIPPFGIMGAAVATALGVSGQHMGAAVMVKRYLGINIYQRT